MKRLTSYKFLLAMVILLFWAVLLRSEVPCHYPSQVELIAQSKDRALVRWDKSRNSSPIELVYGEKGFSPENGIKRRTRKAVLELKDLTPSTVYECYARPICQYNVGEWKYLGEFTTYEENTLVITGQRKYKDQAVRFEVPKGYFIDYLDLKYSIEYDNSQELSRQRSMWAAPALNRREEFYFTGTPTSGNRLVYERKSLNFLKGVGGKVTLQPLINSSGSFSLDWSDFELVVYLQDRGTCYVASEMGFSPVFEDRASVVWQGDETVEQWQLEYGLQGFTPGSGVLLTIDDEQLELTGLAPLTSYDVYVRALCLSGEWGEWSTPFAFQTVDEFQMRVSNILLDGDVEELESEFQDCINFLEVQAPQGYYIVGTRIEYALTAANGGLKSHQFSRIFLAGTEEGEEDYTQGQGEEEGTAYYLKESIDWLNGLSSGALILDARRSFSSGGQEGCNTFNQKVNADLWQVTVNYQALPTCPIPSALVLQSVDLNSATLSWEAGEDVQSWDLEWGLKGFKKGQGTLIENLPSPQYSFTGLLRNADYDVYLRSRCSDEESFWSSEPYGFSTLRGEALTVSQNLGDFPSDDQSPSSCRSALNIEISDEFVVQSFDLKYVITAQNNSGGPKNQRSKLLFPSLGLSESNYFEGEGEQDGMFFYQRLGLDLITGRNGSFLSELDIWRTSSSPGFEGCTAFNQKLEGNSWELTFYLDPNCGAAEEVQVSSLTESSAILYMKMPSNTERIELEYAFTGFSLGDGINKVVELDAEGQYLLDGLQNSTAYEFYIKTFCTNGLESNWVGPFSFETAPEPCEFTQGFEVVELTMNSVRLGWQGQQALEFEIEYGVGDFAQGTGTVISTSNNFVQIDALTPGLRYTALIRTVCFVNNFSPWSQPLDFTPLTEFSQTFVSGNLPTDTQGPSSCSSLMTLNIPDGYEISGIDVEYQMTSTNGASISDQLSRVFAPTSGQVEESYSVGIGGNPGTFSYSRINLDLLNGFTGEVQLGLEALRNPSLGAGCSGSQVFVVQNSFKVTVRFQFPPPPITLCNPEEDLPITNGNAFFNFGSATFASSFRNLTSYSLGEPVIGESRGLNFNSLAGFWGRLVLPPKAPVVMASQGDFPDRVEIKWNLDPLSPTVDDAFVILRNNSFLAQLDPSVRQFLDFNVQAGEFYDYEVLGRSQFGIGNKGGSTGFVNPNGLITGKIETQSRNPVGGVVVKMSPTEGKSLSFNGQGDHLCISAAESMDLSKDWSLSLWVNNHPENTNGSTLLDFGADLLKNVRLETLKDHQNKGWRLLLGDGASLIPVDIVSPNVKDNLWMQLTLVRSGQMIKVYLDGNFITAQRVPQISYVPATLNLGCDRLFEHYYKGNIDELRFFNRALNSQEIFTIRDITLSSQFEGLAGYWKFDEGFGERVFDLSPNKNHAFRNGPLFSNKIPDISNSGITDEGGFYTIQGINYANNSTFKVRPTSFFASRSALEFDESKKSQAPLTAFALSDSTTLEMIVYPYVLMQKQTLLSNGQIIDFYIENGSYTLKLGSNVRVLGEALTKYEHVSLVIDFSQGKVQFYKEGIWISAVNYPINTFDFSKSKWLLGALNLSQPRDIFNGLVDEIAFYKGLLGQDEIVENVQNGANSGNGALIAFFPLDEGSGAQLNDFGPKRTGMGMAINTFFVTLAKRQQILPRIFRPVERVVNLNNSQTAVSGIDFTDESLVTISGVVRFENTFCYQDSVEILVNGAPFFPRIFTDAEGRFSLEIEPGSTVNLMPKYEDHVFLPGTATFSRVFRPVAGVLFVNTTKRTIVGQMAGNDQCRLSVIPAGANVKVKVQALNDCFSREIKIEDMDGKFSFKNLPPIPYTVSVTEHSNNIIYEYFQVQGGKELNMRRVIKDTADFIYVSPPNVFIQPFTENGCPGDGLKMIEQTTERNGYREYSTNIRVFELYNGEACFLDTFHLTIENEIANAGSISLDVSNTTTYEHKYFAGMPNLGGDYTKFMQVTANVNGALATAIERVVVLGERSRESTFTTASPATPILILRDPPGDGSFAALAAGKTHCTSWSNALLYGVESSLELNVDLGKKTVNYAGTPVGGVITETEEFFDNNFSASIGLVDSRVNSAEFCVTTEKEYATSDGADVFFGNADLYVGAAINFEFSATDVLSFDPNTCAFDFGNNVRVWPESFGTKYIYSQWQIETDVIPSLELIGDTASADAWKRIIQYNKDLKAKAVFRENLSFDALTSYTETFTSTKSSSLEFTTEFTWDASFNSTTGISFFGVGTKVTFSYSVGGGIINTVGSSSENTRTVSFSLADDDPNDNFTIDVLDDPVFATPVFRLRSGESMCPWEPGTLNREEVGFSVDRLSAVNIPANEPAVFRLTLTNLGQTGNDPMIYILGLKEGSNPDGAIVAVDGAPLAAGPKAYQIQPFQSLEILLTIRRGPTTYTFNDIGIFMASQCQWEHSRGLGYDLAGFYNSPNEPFQAMYRTQDLLKFYKEVKLNVQYIEPCSPVNIGFPLQDWVVTPNDGDNLFITINDYLYQDPQLKLMRVQYRRTGGDGSWINIVELDKSEFANDPVFKIVPWDLSELADGPYEIRAITECFSVSLNPGISEVIKGRKETQPPLVFGIPQPSDGVLDRGDEISIQFSKRINCNKIFKADGIGTNINFNNIALLDMTAGGTLVDFEFVCREDKLVLLPQIQWRFIENHVLRAVVDGIEDLYGNPTGRIEWEFLVNQSSLFWEGGLIQEKTQEGHPLSVSRSLRNQGAFAEDFALKNIPSWMNVFPRQGTVQPGQTLPINFSFPSELLGGKYQQTVVMEGNDGNKPLEVNLRVFCEAPDWIIQPNNFDFSMNLTLRLNIEGSFSVDELDRVGAFVNGERRGVGQVEYNPILDDYFVFLTVYSNQSVGEILTFQIWHSEDCILYGQTAETFVFVGDGNVGSPSNPQTLHTTGSLFRKVYFNPGWNWFSYNVALPDSSANGVMSSLKNPENGLVKGQTRFSVYSEALNGWIGNLTTLNTTAMYQYKASAVDSIVLIGPAVFAESPIALQAGWNWIGYLPLRSMPVPAALESLSPSDGDIIKSQRNFAQYVQGFGWVGSLRFMAPLSGYLLRISSPSTLIYPSSYGRGSLFAPVYVSQKEEFWPQANRWDLNPADYEFSMNAIALVRRGAEENILEEGDEVAAFFGEEVRGVSRAFYLQELDSYLLFMTLYANQEGEALSFKYFNGREGSEGNLKEIVPFSANQVLGSVVSPFEFNMADTQVSVNARKEEKGISLQVFPNPASEWIYCKVHTQWAEPVEITLYDLQGRALQTLTRDARFGLNVYEWSLGSDISSGVYIVKVSNSKGSQSQILSIQK
jgi:hypothetical protein